MAPASPITRTTTLLPPSVVVSPSDPFRGGLSRETKWVVVHQKLGADSNVAVARVDSSPVPSESDLIASGQRAGASLSSPGCGYGWLQFGAVQACTIQLF